jgi:hypothetical protein
LEAGQRGERNFSLFIWIYQKFSLHLSYNQNPNQMTKFEQAQEQVKEGKLKTPSVSAEGKNINYFAYQLAVHKYNLSLMAKGLKFRGITFSQIKDYYGLKGRSAKDCLEQFEKIMADYSAKFEASKAV